MGRVWDALKRDSSESSESASARAVPIEDAGPMLAEPEEIPFIEVGPCKSIEASPSVLAGTANGQRPLAGDKRTNRRSPTIQQMNVPFRAVFLAAPETEAETPQTDLAGCIVAADQ